MDEMTWDNMTKKLCQKLREKAQSYETPLSISANDDLSNGALLGTGNYVSVEGHILIATCAHVVKEAQGNVLAHLPFPGSFYHRITGHIIAGDYELHPNEDVAITPVTKQLTSSWPRNPLSLVDPIQELKENDLVFIAGHPSQGSRMSGIANALLANGSPFLSYCSGVAVDGFEHPLDFFDMPYPSSRSLPTVDGRERHLRSPPGLSGSIAIGIPNGIAHTGDIDLCLKKSFVAGMIVRWDGNNERLIGIKQKQVFRLLSQMTKDGAHLLNKT